MLINSVRLVSYSWVLLLGALYPLFEYNYFVVPNDRYSPLKLTKSLCVSHSGD